MLKPFFATHREFEAHLQDCYDYSALGEDDFKIFLLTTEAFQTGLLREKLNRLKIRELRCLAQEKGINPKVARGVLTERLISVLVN